MTGVVGLVCFADRGGVEGVEGEAVDSARKPKPLVFLPTVNVSDADGGGESFVFDGFLKGERRDVEGLLRAGIEDGDGGA